MAKEKTKRNLFARVPNWMKVWGGAHLAGAILIYGLCGFQSGEWNPLRQGKAWNAKMEVKREQSELRKKRLGLLAGPLDIDIPYITRKIYSYGYLVGHEPDRKATEKERKRVEELGARIFGKNGYADANKDGRINLAELTDAYIWNRQLKVMSRPSKKSYDFPKKHKYFSLFYTILNKNPPSVIRVPARALILSTRKFSF